MKTTMFRPFDTNKDAVPGKVCYYYNNTPVEYVGVATDTNNRYSFIFRHINTGDCISLNHDVCVRVIDVKVENSKFYAVYMPNPVGDASDSFKGSLFVYGERKDAELHLKILDRDKLAGCYIKEMELDL